MNNLSDFQQDDDTEKEEWIRIYDAVIEGELRHLPHGFWESKGKEKLKVLMRHFRDKNEFGRQEILDTPNRELIRDAKLYSGLESCYDGNSVKLLTDVFKDVKPYNFRWTSNREIDWDKVRRFRNHYCTLSAIANYFGCQTNVLRKRSEEKKVDLSLPDEKSMIQAPVEEVEFFWKCAEKVLKGEISLEQMIDKLSEENEWPRSKTINLANRYNIKKEAGRSGSKIGKKTGFEDFEGRIYPSEEFVLEKLDENEIVVLDGYGADFVYRDDILIEAKKTLGTYNTAKALLQLVYAEDKLGKTYDKRVYAREIGNLEGEESSYRSFTNFYDIGIYEYKEETKSFEKIEMSADRFKG